MKTKLAHVHQNQAIWWCDLCILLYMSMTVNLSTNRSLICMYHKSHITMAFSPLQISCEMVAKTFKFVLFDSSTTRLILNFQASAVAANCSLSHSNFFQQYFSLLNTPILLFPLQVVIFFAPSVHLNLVVFSDHVCRLLLLLLLWLLHFVTLVALTRQIYVYDAPCLWFGIDWVYVLIKFCLPAV